MAGSQRGVMSSFFRKRPNSFPKLLHHFTPSRYTALPALGVTCHILAVARLIQCYDITVRLCASPMANDVWGSLLSLKY